MTAAVHECGGLVGHDGGMRPAAGEVLHFSEDPTIREFVPRPSRTGGRPGPAYVWAVDESRTPSYWFPRQCPRAMAWRTPASTDHDVERILGPGDTHRVHAIEYDWLDRLRTVRLFAYRLPAHLFTPIAEPEPHAQVATVTVRPLGPPVPVGDVLALHEAARIQLRILPTLWPFWGSVITTSLGFSGIRLHHARPDHA